MEEDSSSNLQGIPFTSTGGDASMSSEKKQRSEFTEMVIRVIASIPEGMIFTYGGVAAAAGNPRGARVVVWVLNASSEREGLSPGTAS